MERSIPRLIPHAVPPKMAVINDLTGFGRCSLAVVLPIVSAMKAQACPVPTSVFSNHMGFPSYYYKDLSDGISSYLNAYDTMGICFDGIYCGFLSSPQQFHGVFEFIKAQRRLSLAQNRIPPVILVDPVMGDLGKPYKIVTNSLRLKMKRLVRDATIVTPNLTESCMLTDTVYPASVPSGAFLHELAERLLDMGPSKVAITGISKGNFVSNYCAEMRNGKPYFFAYGTPFNGESRPGTGDIFASILMADAVVGAEFEASVRKAADFIQTCVDASSQAGVPVKEGVMFEHYLSLLIPRQE